MIEDRGAKRSGLRLFGADPYIAAALGDELAKAVAATTLMQNHETFAALRALGRIDASGVGTVQPANYWYKEVGYYWRVRGFAQSGTLDGDARTSTLLVTRGASALGAKLSWRIAIAAVRALVERDRWFTIAATSDDGAFGFTLSSHVGYHPREIHDDETVYEVSRWHPLPA